MAAAKNALRKKKTLEHQLEQTSAQMLTLEREISSIETANINKETLDAMKSASAAMKQIHGGLTIDKVDATMYAMNQFLPAQQNDIHFVLDTDVRRLQGGPPRPTCHRRGDCRGAHTRRRYGGRFGRRRARGRIGGAAAGGARQQDDQDGHNPRT